ncbi:hypothetical protein MVES1_003186 [Malassezia vespertilionis]|uniref:Uncharacterized protein n=1 Tax=Malassezia vespertilionis TaxID=2020962 RepID=A0A2N1J8X8_9BASI|nr:uncharacterized protein MVES1_003186 [Malassezia vespertilionis]PKI82996.1 hypothetical protein MVES_003025 [Malassezia vespertilionis]WFD07815.1 hypothetical protein MVES1_003186 [Malassezia vespertilionis]
MSQVASPVAVRPRLQTEPSKLMPGSIVSEMDPLISAFHSPATAASDARQSSTQSLQTPIDRRENVSPMRLPPSDSVDAERHGALGNQAVEKGEARAKPARPEVLIVVQPSLKKQQQHPYNLQIQLLSPSVHANASAGAGEQKQAESGGSQSNSHAGTSENGRSCSRTNSISSSKSGHSGISDISLNSGGHSSRRTIPLYTLDFHSIRASHMVDAGTDQQVAKFSRRGIEIADFGVLQPVEIVYMDRGQKMSRAVTSEDELHTDHGQESSSEMAHGAHEGDEHRKKLRVKFIRGIRRFGDHLRQHNEHVRQDEDHVAQTSSLSSIPLDRSGTLDQAAAENYAKQNRPASHIVSHLSPGAGVAHGKLTTAYHWKIKRLDRRVDTEKLMQINVPKPLLDTAVSMNGGELDEEVLKHLVSHLILTNVWTHFNVHNRMGAAVKHLDPHTINPHFEWVRDVELPDAEEDTNDVRLRDTSTKVRSASADLGDSDRFSYASWTCYIVLDTDTRIPIGQLKPAPHHPLVVCQLALPNPLPDLRFSGIGIDSLGFSREELRDIVVVTATHLAIRESLGSLHKM